MANKVAQYNHEFLVNTDCPVSMSTGCNWGVSVYAMDTPPDPAQAKTNLVYAAMSEALEHLVDQHNVDPDTALGISADAEDEDA